MKTHRIQIISVFVFLAILILVTDSSSPASAGHTAGNTAAPKSVVSTCTQLLKADGVPTPDVINFDDLKSPTAISENYQAVHGVVFIYTNDNVPTALEDASAPSSPNVAANLGVGSSSNANLPMVITFDKPMSAVGMTIGGGDGSTTTATLTAYNASDKEICHATLSPVPVSVSTFLGLKDDAGAEIRKISIDYGAVENVETIDDLLFTSYVPPIPCDVTLSGYPASVNVGSRVVVNWDVAKNSYSTTQTYLVYDSVSHPQAGAYSGYQVPSPNTGSGEFSSGILARSAGTMYIRPALSYQETPGSLPVTCQGADEIAVTVNAVSPTPPPTPGSITGFVTNPKGTGLAGVLVQACFGSLCQSDTTKSGGAFTFANLTALPCP